jgi:hypothetical protein
MLHILYEAAKSVGLDVNCLAESGKGGSVYCWRYGVLCLSLGILALQRCRDRKSLRGIVGHVRLRGCDVGTEYR